MAWTCVWEGGGGGGVLTELAARGFDAHAKRRESLLPEKYRRISKARYRESVEIGKRKVNSHYQNRSE